MSDQLNALRKIEGGFWSPETVDAIIAGNWRPAVTEAQQIARAALAGAQTEQSETARLLYRGAVDMHSIVSKAQNILSRHVDPSGDLQDPKETVNALLGLLDHRDTLAMQRACLSQLREIESAIDAGTQGLRDGLAVALTDPACDLPDEVRHLFREYLEAAQ